MEIKQISRWLCGQSKCTALHFSKAEAIACAEKGVLERTWYICPTCGYPFREKTEAAKCCKEEEHEGC